MTMRFPSSPTRLGEIALYAAGPSAIFLTAPLLARGLGPTGRGEFGLAQAVASFALAIGSIGQAEVFLADSRNGKGNFRGASIVAMIGGSLTAILAFVTMGFMGVATLVALAAVIPLPVLAQSQLWRSVAIDRGKIIRPAYNSAVAATIRVMALLALFQLSLITVTTAMSAVQLAAATAAVCTLGVFAIRDTRHPARQATECLSLVLRGSPLLLFSALTSITLRSDILVLQHFESDRIVGVYAAASSLSISVLAVSGAFRTRIQAAFSARAPKAVLAREFRIVVLVGIGGMITGVMASPIIVSVLLGAGYEGAVSLLRVLSVGAFGLFLMDIIHGSLVSLGERKAMVFVALVGAAVTVAALGLLVPAYGAMGAATASTISYWAAVFAGYWVIRRSLAEL